MIVSFFLSNLFIDNIYFLAKLHWRGGGIREPYNRQRQYHSNITRATQEQKFEHFRSHENS